MPWCKSQNFNSVCGRFKLSSVGIWFGMFRNVAPTPLLLRLTEDLFDIAVELRIAEIAELDRHEVAVQTQHGRDADGEVHVRAALRQSELEERVDTGHYCRFPETAVKAFANWSMVS
jgi:hypothetical protein